MKIKKLLKTVRDLQQVEIRHGVDIMYKGYANELNKIKLTNDKVDGVYVNVDGNLVIVI